MPPEADTYAKTDRTTVKRVPKRAHYDRDTVHAILDAGLIAHVGFAVEGQPFVIPTAYARVDEVIYIHGSPASRLLRTLEGGVEVCLTVTLLDGLVMARSVFHHSMNYRSVVAFGQATLVQDPDEKLQALKAFTEHIVPGRWDEARPPSPQELAGTWVLALPITEASAKVRTGPPVDDAADYALPIWAGEIPLRLTPEPPQTDPQLAATVPIAPSVTAYYQATHSTASV